MASVTVVSFDAAQVRAFLSQLPERLAVRATVRALNKVATNVRTVSVRAIRQRRALSAKAVREGIRIIRATNQQPISSLVVTGKPISLKEYGARGKPGNPNGVSVMVTPGQRKFVTHHGNKAFIADTIGGHVFARETSARLPIRKLFGPSLPSTFATDQVRAIWTAAASESMIKRLTEEVRFELLRRSGT